MPWLKILLGLPSPLRRSVLAASSLYGRTTGQEKWLRLGYLAAARLSADSILWRADFSPPFQVSQLLGVSAGELKRSWWKKCSPIQRRAPTERPSTSSKCALPPRPVAPRCRRLQHGAFHRDAHSVPRSRTGLPGRLPCRRRRSAPTASTSPRSWRRFPIPSRRRRPPQKNGLHVSHRPVARRQPRADARDRARSDALDARETSRLFRAFGAGRLHWSRAWAMVVLGAVGHALACPPPQVRP
jgi:hypothetical protein